MVDYQALVRAGSTSILQRPDEIGVVGEAADGVEALEAVDRTRPAVVLTDVRMPRLDGIVASRQLRTRHPPVRVVVLTT